MKKSYQEAEKSLWIGESSKPELRFHRYQDLGIYRLINFEDKEEILKYYYEYIHPLEEHFKDEYFTEMMKTLEKYIECGFSYTEVANRTHIHRNTVKYRIDAIERTCGIDLADHNTRLDIEVITKIYPILGKIIDK
jgi:DNA-binding PucR family transcriptional regulator